MQVIAHQVARDAAQRFLHAGDLRDDVRAVAVVFHHFLQAANLAFDAAQAVAIRRFDFGIDGNCFTRARFARARGAFLLWMLPFTGRVRFRCHARSIYPPPLYMQAGALRGPFARTEVASIVVCASTDALQNAWRSTDGSLCYYAAHDTCGSNLRIAEAAAGRTTTCAANVAKHLWFAAFPDRRQESFVVRVRCFTPAEYGSGARTAAFEYCGDAEG